MRKILKLGLLFGCMVAVVGATDVYAATTKRQSALQAGTKVRARVDAKGIYAQECYDAYFGCMDQFCIADNENGGSCACSDDSALYEEQLESIRKTIAEAERISTEEVEKVQAGANADIIFNGGERIYNADGSVVKAGETSKDKKITWSSVFDNEEDNDEDIWESDDFSGQTGKALYNSANRLCKEQMPESCAKDMTLLTQMYSRQIVSDCKGLANSIAQKKQEADSALNQAKAAVRGALKDSLEESNQYDRGTCMVEYKKCMKSADACGSDWSNCVFTIASENMQNNASVSVAGTKVKTINTYDITASTMEILESKRFICEKVLDKCVAVRDYVWNDFLREAAPTIRLAEQNVESKKRQSCLTDISNCIQTACKDDIVGKGTATMDACLARPDMARSFCKVQIDPCERMEPQIWDYVVSKLAAMRVDACTNEVKECVMSEDRCGPDFMNCIGMDFDYIHDMCPIEKLVVCKQTNKDFKISDLDEMLMGLYLNIDNKALENCTKLAEEKMVEVCGSLDGCSVFAKDEYIGTGSIKSQKNGTVYRVTGRMALGALKMGDALGNVKDGNKVLAPGQIGVSDYIQKVKKQNKSVPNADSIIASIESELNSIAGSVDRVISLIESDQQVQYCINGRDLSQINGKGTRNNSTGARFPNLLNQYRVTIAQAALSKAEDNYQKKYAEAIAQATKNASVDVAQYMCQMIPSGVETKVNDSGQTVTGESDYAIVYEIDSGLDANSLMSGGSRTVNFDSASLRADSYLTASIGRTEIPGGTKTIRSTFNRETRVCHICTELVTRECKQKGINLQFFVTDTRRLECGEEKREETCEDVAM